QWETIDVRRRHPGPLFLVPAAAEDPVARPRLLRRLADHPDDVVPVSRRGQLEVARGFTNAGEMNVRVDEPRRRERALEVDDPGCRTEVALDLLVGSERDDGVAVDRQGGDFRPGVVDGDDGAAANHEIRRTRGGRRRLPARV